MSAAEARIKVAQTFPDSRETVEKIAAAKASASPTRASRNLNQMSTASRRKISCTRAKRAPSEEVFDCSDSLMVGLNLERSTRPKGGQSGGGPLGRFRNLVRRGYWKPALLGRFVGSGNHFDGNALSSGVVELNLFATILPRIKEFGIANVVVRVLP